MNKILKSFIVGLILLITIGCVYQKTDITDVKKSLQFCEDKAGLKHIQIMFSGAEYVYCVNGEHSGLGSIDLNVDN